MTSSVDVVIFGAGPAGLAAAMYLICEGHRVTLLEHGKSVTKRGRHDPEDLASGVGGAGLYSDGKFSFFPSGSGLWELHDRAALRTAYAWLTDVLRDFTAVPAFAPVTSRHGDARLSERLGKSYPSKYIGFNERVELIARLTRDSKGSLLTGASVARVEPASERLRVAYERHGRTHAVQARAAIMAGGRFGAVALGEIAPWLPVVFRRYEVGLRLEAASESFFLQSHPDIDPKYILKDASGVEWRTFCTCRNGEVVETRFNGLTTYSGRSDVGATQFSNVGFNVRILEEPAEGSQLDQELRRLLNGGVRPFRLGLGQFVNGGATLYGPVVDELLREGLRRLGRQAVEEVVVTGPVIEGVGHYPLVNRDLQVPELPLWVAGDETGIFRGLTAALVSGHYAAQQANRLLTRSTPPLASR